MENGRMRPATQTSSVSSCDLMAFNFQVGGHGQGLTHGKSMMLGGNQGELVMKPLMNDGRGDKEVQFYEKVFEPSNTNEVTLQLRTIIPQFKGVVTDEDGNKYLALANKAEGFVKPCVLDFKMGRITTSPLASAEKTERERKKYPQQNDIGFRFVGMKVYEPSKGAYRNYERAYGYSLKVEDVPRAFDEWLTDGTCVRKDIVAPAIEGVKEILAWFETNNQFLFFGASVLIIHEGDTTVPDHKGKVRVAFIDFAHVLPIEDPSQRDENNIYGIRRLLGFLEEKLER
eukprot:comp11938_c0_seq1/m.6611 comp11938_c0_seq1/g.6611  ORF comp11938_c0_seq1/g.6611 comp11938_c0_seq1/m.6611 type:complete len:286 (-) comp11938_c0_seq1:51-908(-)